MSLPLVYHHGYVSPLPEGHRFPMPKFKLLYELLIKDGVAYQDSVFTPELIDDSTIFLAHSSDYINRFRNGDLTHGEVRKSGLPWSPELVTRTMIALSGSVLSARLAHQHGIACNLAGGTHHAHYNFGSGFCIVNDLAVTSLYLISQTLAKKILIIDLDVHQGDGTANILSGNEDVFTFSIHCKTNFPFIKAKSSLDIEVDELTEDKSYLRLLYDVIPGLLDDIKPDFVIYDAGVDVFKDDPLGKISISLDGIYNRDHYIIEEVNKRGIPISCVIGGGYSKNLNELAYRHSLVHRAAKSVFDNAS
ncbi:MAG: histone deacetylase [Ignavibacteriaceae bacterium]|nr:histone deacetylase [Ignavibacteriaceae bacterium]